MATTPEYDYDKLIEQEKKRVLGAAMFAMYNFFQYNNQPFQSPGIIQYGPQVPIYDNLRPLQMIGK
jgi:hypothetical protein